MDGNDAESVEEDGIDDEVEDREKELDVDIAGLEVGMVELGLGLEMLGLQ